MNKPASVAFYVRNGFQVSHLRPLFKATPDARWVVTSPKDVERFGIGHDPCSIARILLRRHVDSYDFVVSHAGPPRGKPLAKAIFIMVQYGYAKEPYNFGSWRGQADAICAYGPYGAERFAEHAPAFSIGNPRWDDWSEAGFKGTAQAAIPTLNPNKPVVLYAPTWGELSSLGQWTSAVLELSKSYNVLIKAHHNSRRDGQLPDSGEHNDVYDVSDVDLMLLLALSDVLLSDYSGAIFDGIMCDIPVVLLDVAGVEEKFGNKLDAESIEIARRSELGRCVSNSDLLAKAVAEAVNTKPAQEHPLKAELFAYPANVGDAFVAMLATLKKSKR